METKILSIENLRTLSILMIALVAANQQLVDLIKKFGKPFFESKDDTNKDKEWWRKLRVQILTIICGYITAVFVTGDWMGSIVIGKEADKIHLHVFLLAFLIAGPSGFWNEVLKYANALRNVKQENVKTLKEAKMEGQKMSGTCVNSTGETVVVYGPKSSNTPQDKDNALYRLPSGRRTPQGWDCDGIYTPNDRIANQVVGDDIQGPVAIKYVGILTFEIKKEGNKYVLPPNQGAFIPSEVCCPSNYPTCVCWDIPNKAHNELADYQEVPSHLPA